MRSGDGQALRAGLPGQYIVLRLRPSPDAAPLFRSYSLSGPPSQEHYRISVKIEPNGAAGTYLRDVVRVGDVLEASQPRGSFILQSGTCPVVLLSAGIGATPVLAMLYSLAGAHSPRQVLWLYGTKDREHHPFAAEVRQLMRSLPNSVSQICYSSPASGDRVPQDFDTSGHLSQSVFDKVGVPRDADVYLCGPVRFMADMKMALAKSGVAAERIHVELFNGSEPITPGVVDRARPAPHAPGHDAGTGTLVSFARSGVAAHWDASAYQSILELAEACDVPVRWSCRTGVCHTCESGLVSGTVVYGPEPLETPADGNLLVCCSQPVQDVVIDL